MAQAKHYKNITWSYYCIHRRSSQILVETTVLAVRSWGGGGEFCSLFPFAPSPLQALAVPLSLISMKEFTTSTLNRKISSLQNKHELPGILLTASYLLAVGGELAPLRASFLQEQMVPIAPFTMVGYRFKSQPHSFLLYNF